METTKTHWKKLTNPDYIGAYALAPKEERNVQIVKVVREIVTGPEGKKEECTVAHLKGEKPFILNTTNQKTISKILDSPYIEDWAGKWITLYTSKVKAFGDTVDALRVKPVAPVVKLPDLTPTHPNWGKVVEGLRNGATIEQVRTKYTLSAANEKLLKDAIT